MKTKLLRKLRKLSKKEIYVYKDKYNNFVIKNKYTSKDFKTAKENCDNYRRMFILDIIRIMRENKKGKRVY